MLGNPGDYDFDAAASYSGGANRAFDEAAEIARKALGGGE